ncbi:conjugative transfer protein TrbI [alpha proteobacterium U9-1i]|nr:conjugative transfer protein TrbI [alpha proteobacterium U9-1i]
MSVDAEATAGAKAPQTQARPQPAPTTSIRAAPPKPRRLSRKTLMAGTLVLGGLIAFALVNGLSTRDRHHAVGRDAQSLQTANPPENIREAPANYDQVQLQPPVEEGHDFLWGDHQPPDAHNMSAPPTTSTYAPPTSPSPLETEADAARTSSILFGHNNGGARPTASGAQAVSGPHSGFVNAQAGRDDGVLDATYVPPRSPYMVQSGSTISAALVTALNSDQPGRVIAQVSENVFDSVTGQQLLIPQGARLIGTYDADNSYGEQRVLVVWNRLIMPNGWSIALRGMPGTDATGAAGLHGDVDAHLGRIAVASLISGVLGVTANESQDDNSSRFAQSVGDSAAQQAAQTGSRIIDRELNVRPTLRVRAGERVRVLISHDLILRPYRQ